MNEWEQAQQFEAHWHETIGANTFHEEEKQFVYASKMGIEVYRTAYTPYNFKNYGKVLDIGGGEVSMLLKVEKPEGCVVVDPCSYPEWVKERYREKGITFINIKAEDIDLYSNVSYPELKGFDEVWFYNVLQHTENPEKICHNALKAGKIVRVFEWIEIGITPGHIHNLTKKDLDKWLGGYGKVEKLDGTKGANGLCYYGIFNGNIA